MTTFKLFFSAADIRRITLEVPDWDSFNRELVTMYPEQFHLELCVRYKDDEGDMITVTTQKEWAAMLEALHGATPVKLYISEGKNSGKYFKDGPAPEPLGVYEVEEGGEKKAVDGSGRTLEFAVPRCLERLIPGGKITPYNLPSWMEGCVEVKRVPGADPTVDLDINVCTLFEQLHKQALSMFSPEAEPQLLRRAKEFLQAMIDLVPNHPLANYNLACAHSLLGELQEGVASLKRAIEGGYSNLKHMLEDSDLKNLHNLPEFKVLVDLLRGKQEKEPEKPVEPEVKLEEPKKEEPVKVEPEVKLEEPKQEEPKKEEPVKVEPEVKLEEPKEKKRWEKQLQTLAGMGFTNADVNEALLTEYKGDMMKVINALLFAH